MAYLNFRRGEPQNARDTANDKARKQTISKRALQRGSSKMMDRSNKVSPALNKEKGIEALPSPKQAKGVPVYAARTLPQVMEQMPFLTRNRARRN